jgi:hypothetical protein
MDCLDGTRYVLLDEELEVERLKAKSLEAGDEGQRAERLEMDFPEEEFPMVFSEPECPSLEFPEPEYQESEVYGLLRQPVGRGVFQRRSV